jgi:ABC-type bacteriocin/lantibiotic exporter with double-glycine peptidase domain
MLIWFAQEFGSSCVAACVRMALNGLGDSRDEAQVRQLIGYTPLGVSLAQAQAQLVATGASAEWHDNWNLADLRDATRAGLYPIVGVERHLLGFARAFHAVIVVQVTSAKVELLDPLDASSPRSYSVAAFTEAWEQAGGEILLIEAPPTN